MARLRLVASFLRAGFKRVKKLDIKAFLDR
jgi:hypothetical protein